MTDQSLQKNFVTDTSRPAPIIQYLQDAKGLIRRSGFRKTILIMDRLFQQCYLNEQEIHPLLIIRIVRRIVKASHKLIAKYITLDEWKKDQVIELLKLQNIYFMGFYASLLKILSKFQDQEEKYGLINLKAQYISPEKTKKILLQILAQNTPLISCDKIYTIPRDVKSKQIQILIYIQLVKFQLIQFWIALIENLISWISYARCKLDVKMYIKFLSSINKLIETAEFLNCKNPQLIHMVALYYIHVGKIYFSLFEFQQTINAYENSQRYLYLEFNMILEQNKAPNNLEVENIKPIKKIIRIIVFVLFQQSILYEIMINYSKVIESLHLALWLLVKVVGDEKSQLLNLILKSYTEAKTKYQLIITEEYEIHQIISLVISRDITSEIDQEKQINEEFNRDKMNHKLYLKHNVGDLNKSQFIIRKPKPQIQEQIVLTNCLLPSLTLDLFKIKDTTQDTSLRQMTKNTNHCSQTSLEQDSIACRKMIQTEISELYQTDSKYKNMTQQSLLDGEAVVTSRKQSWSQKKKKFKISQGDSKQQMTENRQMKVAKILDYCQTENKITSNNFHVLEDEMANLIVKRLEDKSQEFIDINEIQADYIDKVAKDFKFQNNLQNQKEHVLFKKQFQSSGPLEKKDIIDKFTNKKDAQEIQHQYENFHELQLAMEELQYQKKDKAKRWNKPKIQKEENNEKFEQKIKDVEPKGKLKNLLLKHGKEFGLKRMKKQLINAKHEAAHNKNKQNFDLLLIGKKEEEKKSEEEIQQEIAALNQNVIKMIMEDNQKMQDLASHQLRRRKLFCKDFKSSSELQSKQESQRENQIYNIIKQVMQQNQELSQTTQYLSVKAESNKKVSSFLELAELKKKVFQISVQKQEQQN